MSELKAGKPPSDVANEFGISKTQVFGGKKCALIGSVPLYTPISSVPLYVDEYDHKRFETTFKAKVPACMLKPTEKVKVWYVDSKTLEDFAWNGQIIELVC